MRTHSRLIGKLALLLSAPTAISMTTVTTVTTAAAPAAAAAGPVRVVESDERGITLQLDVPPMSLAAQRDGRSVLQAGSLDLTNQPGRPALPYASALIALPPGARAVPRVIASASEEIRSGVRLASNGRSIVRRIDATETFEPVVEPVDPIVDGPWPAAMVELGEELTLRRQRMVSVRILPFRYDEASGRLWTRHSVTVRVDFVGAQRAPGVASRDIHWDRVLRGAVLNFDQARTWHARPEPLRSHGGSLFDDVGTRGTGTLGATATAVAAFDEVFAEVRVQTDTSGVYALRFDDLAANGYPVGVPVGQVSVHRHEFLENSNPAFATVEVPIEVDDANSNDVFDAGDRIVLYVLSWAQRARASFAQRTWGDGEVLYATFITDRAPLRMAARPGWRDLTLTPLLSYPYTERFEQSIGYTRLPPDTNSDQFQMSNILYFPRRDSFPFETHDVDTLGLVTATVTWSGARSTTHAVWAQLRNFRGQFTSLGDSVRWFGYSDFSRTTTIFGSSLTEGPTNVLRTWGKSSGDDLAYARLNWFQLTYWRSYHALEGKFECNNGTTTGAFQIQGYGFNSGAVRVYDVTDSLNPVRLAIDPSHIEFDGLEYSISFQDSSAAPRRYWVFDQPKVVPRSRMGTVVRRALANSAPSNYLMVVPEAWLALAAPLAEFRRAQGYQVLVAPLESIEDEFNGGRRSSYALKRFFKYAFDLWGAEFAVLLGDGSEDPQNLLGDSGPDWIPTQKILGPVPAGDAREAIPSDTWLVSLENPSLPSLFLGRIPANSPEALTAVIAKVIQYETVAPDQTWRRDMLLVADDKYSTVTTFGSGGGSVSQYCEKDYENVFKALSDSVRAIVVRDAGLALGNVEVFDLNYYLRNEPYTIGAGGDTCRIRVDQTQVRTRATVSPLIFDRLNQGRLWWNYQGHANQYVLSHESFYLNQPFDDDKQYLANIDKPFFFSAFSCHANGFAAAHELSDRVGPSIGEDVVMLPNRGAIASWASAGFEILPTPVQRPEHLNTRLAKRLFADPPRDPFDNAARVVLGEVIGQTLVDNFNAEFSSLERDVAKSYVLLGDPATRISVGAPQVVVTANGVPVTSGEPVRLFSFGDTLRLEAEVASNVAIRTLTVEYRDAASSRILGPGEYLVTPAFPDTGTASQGGRRFHISVVSQLSAGSYRYVIRAVDRNGVVVQFDVVFEFQTVLRAGGDPIQPNDPVRSDAELSVLILSPSPIDPITDIELLLNGAPLAFTAAPFQGDTTRREYVLSWNHAPYAAGPPYVVTVKLGGLKVALHSFTVSDRSSFADLMAFPNPFDDELGTRFSFTFTGAQPFDLLLRVYTVSGRLIFQRTERNLQPGYHQLPWDGRDAEGEKLANGIYFYKLLAKSDAGDVVEQGRLVKLRRPRRAIEEEITPP